MNATDPCPVGKQAPFRGSFRLSLKPDGTVVVPDLAEPLIPLLREAGADDALWQKQACVVTLPGLNQTRARGTGRSLYGLEALPEVDLWRLHAELAGCQATPELIAPAMPGEASLLDLKLLLARRLLDPCLLCERRCGAGRTQGEAGFCGLGAGLQVGAYAMLYNEGPLVGAPTFSVFLRGCSLRCSFCYRPDELRARGREETSAAGLAAVLDQAADAGAASWHFLGGNPDESLPGILQALALTCRRRPVVWNSALMLTPSALELLKGVVDVWLPDFKFGNDDCARQLAGLEVYTSLLRRNLGLLRGQPHVVVRHMMMPGHEKCCADPVREFLSGAHPEFLLHTFPMHRTRAGKQH